MSGSNTVSRSTRGITLTADQLNALATEASLLDGLTATATELNALDITAAGTAEASKAVVLNGSKGISTITSATITTLTTTTINAAGVVTATGGVAAAGGFTLRPYNVRTWQPIAATSGTDTACTNGTAYCGSILVPGNCTITGVEYLIGSVGGTTKVIASLHDSAGVLLANSALAGATVGTAANSQQVAFTAPYAAVGPATYYIALTFDGTTAKFRSVPAFCQAGVMGNGVTQTFGTAATFTAPTTFTADKVPVAWVY